LSSTAHTGRAASAAKILEGIAAQNLINQKGPPKNACILWGSNQADPRYIITEVGVGYRMSEEE